LLYHSHSDLIFCFQIYVLKPSHKSTLQSKIIENSIPDSVSAVPNATNPTRDLESEFGAGHEGKIWEISVDNAYPTVCLIVKHVSDFMKAFFPAFGCVRNYSYVVLYFRKELSVHSSNLTRYLFSWLHAFGSQV
jgi:hypothetical protein